MCNSGQRPDRGIGHGPAYEYGNALTRFLSGNLTSLAAGNQYLTCLTIYFIGYVLFEVRLQNPQRTLTNR